ncbi:hypothetical protein [Pelomonas sp. KK5]|uniref:hypothetical protein n=1 Tax=Pelomonas sp. KK5 TaxID=1855730 RepID=UPI00097C393C|nr:hypothetical protein [Pelomonas sp. KK5]
MAHAQSGFQGKWVGTAAKATGEPVQIQLVIAKAGGTLRLEQAQGYVTRDQCLDRDIPVTVNSQTESELNVSIKGNTVLKGCIDETATLKLVDGKTLQGTLQDGRTMKLVKK